MRWIIPLCRAARRALGITVLAISLGTALVLTPHSTDAGQPLAGLDMRDDGSRILNLIVHETPKPVPDVTFVDGTGRTRSLDEFQGKLTAVHFWATWCGPCRTEMPTVDYLQEEIGKDNLAFLAVSVDRKGSDVVASYYDDLGLNNLAIYIDEGMKSARSLRVNGIPYTIFLNRDGLEIARVLGDRDWSQPDAVALVRKLVEM